MKKLALFIVLFSAAAQANYYCEKNGLQVWVDQATVPAKVTVQFQGQQPTPYWANTSTFFLFPREIYFSSSNHRGLSLTACKSPECGASELKLIKKTKMVRRGGGKNRRTEPVTTWDYKYPLNCWAVTR